MVNGVTMDFDTSDAEETSRVFKELSDCCYKMAELFQKLIPGFENSHLDWISPAPGVRFVRQVECDYDITQGDIDNHVVPEDTIGLFGVQDAHFMGYDIKGGEYYGIPYRALLPQNAENLLVAGKMISSDWVVFMSTRLVGACFLQGQAAGTAAALSVKNGCSVRELDVQSLRQTLKKDGAFLND
jgi:hypothetical protein